MDGIGVLRQASTVLPREPGVYRFRDNLDRVIYLGRATALRARVRSYAGELGARRHLRRMVAAIRTGEAIICASVPEAGWLERNLLERSLPRGNRSRGGGELVGWLVVSDDPARPAVDLVVEGADVPSAAYGPYLAALADGVAVSLRATAIAWTSGAVRIPVALQRRQRRGRPGPPFVTARPPFVTARSSLASLIRERVTGVSRRPRSPAGSGRK